MICKKCENLINSDTKCFQCGYDNKITDSATLTTKQTKQKKIIVNIVLMAFVVLLLVIGLILVFSAESYAKSVAWKLASNQRLHFAYPKEIMYEIYTDKYIIEFTTLGIIFSLVAGIGIIFNSYFLYKQIKRK